MIEILFGNFYALGLFVLFVIVAWAYRDVRWRRFQQFKDLTRPKPSLVWGHLDLIDRIRMHKPPGYHFDYILSEIHKELGNPPYFHADLRPFSYPMTVICNHDMAEQISRSSKAFVWSVPKSPLVQNSIAVLGRESMLLQEGEEWKSMRRRFNPGFSPKHLLSLLPCILDKTRLYVEHLDRLARSGEEFVLSELTTNLTFDIIGAVVMEADLDAQLGPERQSAIVSDFKHVTRTYMGASPGVDKLWLRQKFRRWRISRRLDGNIKDVVRATFARQQQQQQSGDEDARSRSVLSLSLQGLKSLDERVVDQTCSQIKTFLFAGHDTTSITLQWAMYELARTPRALAAARAELDDVFGPDSTDPTVVYDRLAAPGGEELLSRLPYASAIMKETLRLYPPAATARMAPSGSNLRLALPGGQGETGCLDGQDIYVNHTIIQRDRELYGETADVFEPERWLGNTNTSGVGDEDLTEKEPGQQQQQQQQDIPVSAWRPFERGPRNCIGQELANIETRLIMACTLRRFDFEKVGLGEFKRDAQGKYVMGSHGQYETISTLYNTNKVTAQPVDGCRMMVRLSDKAEGT